MRSVIREPPAGMRSQALDTAPAGKGQLFWGPQTRTLTAVAQEVGAVGPALNTQSAVRSGFDRWACWKHAQWFYVQTGLRWDLPLP